MRINMETKYAVTRNGQIIVEDNDLEYIKRMKKELEFRQTGRTTRMLFQVLGNNANEIVVVGWHRARAKILFETTCEMLDKLEFPYLANHTDLTIVNFGKTYHFVSQERLTNLPRGSKDIYKHMIKYLDEK